jgi:hypothetical protein
MAAGLGFKTFTTGEVLTAGDVNGYLMQGINVFTNATARDAAITAPAEGQFAFTKDNNSLWYYDGAAWVASGATGDIEGVTAGVGITGGGTSGTVTITNDMATTITAAGDIVVGTGSGTYDNLPIGTTAQVLTADTTVSPYKVKWATPSSGKVVQIVAASTTQQVESSTSTFIDSDLTATITPTSASNKVLVMVSQNGLYKDTNNTGMNLKCLRGATQIGLWQELVTTGAASFQLGTMGFSILDAPATTSATTYKTQFMSYANNARVRVQYPNTNCVSTIVLMEVTP